MSADADRSEIIRMYWRHPGRRRCDAV